MKKNKNLISLIISILVMIVLIQMDPLENANISELIGVAFVFIITFLIIRFILILFTHTAFEKSTEQNIKIKKDVKEIKKAALNNLLEYENAKKSFRYFSNESLINIYSNMKEEGIQNMERLALEETMVEKELLSHSEMHEKLHMIKKHFDDI